MSQHEVTELLQAWGHGDSQAFEKLLPLVDHELRRIAHAYMSKERSGHTLQTTALIHEAVIRLLKSDGIDWHSRVQFYAIAARRMRQILVEHAREQLTAKRGSRAEHLNLSAATHLSIEKSLELINLDAALTELAKLDQRKSNIVEYRYFGGFTIPEIAKMFGVSTATIEREWSLARSWLLKQMSSATGI